MSSTATSPAPGATFRIEQGVCPDALKGIADNSIDSCITDPPAGISFMGQEWDSHKGGRSEWIAWLTEIMAECWRVLKPGGHIFVWALPRTSHWTATAIEDAGFQIRDVATHLFGSGFPKSKNVGDGRGTALKPANEHWILARKPLSAANVTANVAQWGTGVINVDVCRVATNDEVMRAPQSTPSNRLGVVGRNLGISRAAADVMHQAQVASIERTQVLGRWPSNLLLTHSAACNGVCAPDCPVRLLDEQSGVLTSGQPLSRVHTDVSDRTAFGVMKGTYQHSGFGDSGGASRFFPTFSWDPEYDAPFFYCAKASRSERETGCESITPKTHPWTAHREEAHGGKISEAQERFATSPSANSHPTVKPIKLMRWLCRLITPPGGIILDPFTGSGSTGVAAIQEGFQFIGIEREPEYHRIATARIEHAASQGRQTSFLEESA